MQAGVSEGYGDDFNKNIRLLVYFCLCVLPFTTYLGSSWCMLLCCSLSFLLSSPLSLMLCSLVLDIILRSCGNLDPVLSNTSPCHYPVLSLIHLSSYWRSPELWAQTLYPCMHDCTPDGWQAFWAFIRHCCVCLFPSSPLLSPSLLLSHRVGAATSSCNPALQKAVIELEIHAGIIAVIWGRR